MENNLELNDATRLYTTLVTTKKPQYLCIMKQAQTVKSSKNKNLVHKKGTFQVYFCDKSDY